LNKPTLAAQENWPFILDFDSIAPTLTNLNASNSHFASGNSSDLLYLIYTSGIVVAVVVVVVFVFVVFVVLLLLLLLL
jgi:hypothetical protein